MEPVAITEEMHMEKEWFRQACEIETPDGLASFVAHLLNDYYHDYGTVCHAVAACALAAAWCACKNKGITGFQAGFVMWDFVRQWNHTENECGMRLIDYDKMLFPQYEDDFEKTISQETWEALQKTAKKKIEDHCEAHPLVLAHWQSITDGKVPFGYCVERR